MNGDSDNLNPYASPQVASEPDTDDVDSSEEIWRMGDWVIMPIGSELPHRCVKCNKPGSSRRKLRAIWLTLYTGKDVSAEYSVCARHGHHMTLQFAWYFYVAIGMVHVWFQGNNVILVLWLVGVFAFTLADHAFSAKLHWRRDDLGRDCVKGCGKKFLESLPDGPSTH